jgi:hypothetical protein
VVKIFAAGPNSQFTADIEINMIFRANVRSALVVMSAHQKSIILGKHPSLKGKAAAVFAVVLSHAPREVTAGAILFPEITFSFWPTSAA